MGKKVWVFKGMENNQSMECNDIDFLLYQVMVIKGIKLPHTSLYDLKFHQATKWNWKSPSGGTYELSIEEVIKS